MFKPIPQVDQLAVHFQLEGNLIQRDSEDAKRQLARDTGGKSFFINKTFVLTLLNSIRSFN